MHDFILNCVNRVFYEIYQPKYECSLRITQSWCNYTKSDQYHHRHEHPNSFLSGVFYINADEEVDKITFFNPIRYKQISFIAKEWNVFNSESWWIPVSSGKLVIFPSSLSHAVEYKSGENIRTSLAFNTFPVGKLGSLDGLTELFL